LIFSPDTGNIEMPRSVARLRCRLAAATPLFISSMPFSRRALPAQRAFMPPQSAPSAFCQYCRCLLITPLIFAMFATPATR